MTKKPPVPTATPTEVRRIRTLFAHARPAYSIAESAAILGMSEEEIRRELEEGSVATLRFGGDVRIAWADLVWLGLVHRWTYRTVSDAVRGHRTAALLPPLVRVVPGRVELPRYQWRVLGLLAAARRREQGGAWSASDVLEEAVRDFVVASIDDWQEFETVFPGVRAASEWPERNLEKDGI
jgi:hypothetical protein